jgi:dethiobiotin synthetase
MNYFITGTDTGVGKTYFTALLTRALRKAGFDTTALKPICCGPREDVHILRAASGGEFPPDEINPIFFEHAVAPLAAAREETRTVDMEQLAAWFLRLRPQRQSLLVEGVGGWLVPITENKTVADLALLTGLPVLIVVANRLGCLNHTLLTIESIRARGLACAGLVLNTLAKDQSLAAKTNREILQECCDVPVLFEIHPGQQSLELAVA